MKPKDDPLLWKYLDGEASEQERTWVQRRLTDDGAFKAELESRQQLHHSLQQMEAEQPSMRFVINVMDSLPQLYKKTIEPLVSPTWMKAFVGSFVVFVIGLLGYAAVSANSDSTNNIPGENFIHQLNALPTSIFTILAILSFSYLFFVLLDKQLKKRFNHKLE